MINQLSSKTINEVVPITFDFTNVLDTVTAIETITNTVVFGADPAAAAMLAGAAEIQGGQVVQLFQGGVADAVYEVLCLVTSGGEKYQLVGQMLVTAY
jgi:hypothetical protein